MPLAAEQPASLSRRQLLFGRATGTPVKVYPPWARSGIERCTGCGDCASACPQGILKLDASRLPVVDFYTNECSFCHSCASACEASVYDLTTPPWELKVTFGDNCFVKRSVYCRTCGDNCPEGAIRFSLKPDNHTTLTVDKNACTGCGACVTSCPVAAVHIAPETTTVESATQ